MPSAISGPYVTFLGLSNHTQAIATQANQVKSPTYIVQVKSQRALKSPNHWEWWLLSDSNHDLGPTLVHLVIKPKTYSFGQKIYICHCSHSPSSHQTFLPLFKMRETKCSRHDIVFLNHTNFRKSTGRLSVITDRWRTCKCFWETKYGDVVVMLGCPPFFKKNWIFPVLKPL